MFTWSEDVKSLPGPVGGLCIFLVEILIFLTMLGVHTVLSVGKGSSSNLKCELE